MKKKIPGMPKLMDVGKAFIEKKNHYCIVKSILYVYKLLSCVIDIDVRNYCNYI